MRKACVKGMENLWMTTRKTSARPSTHFIKAIYSWYRVWVQPVVFQPFTHKYPRVSSTAKIAYLPLVEQKFYPVSTGPIIRATK